MCYLFIWVETSQSVSWLVGLPYYFKISTPGMSYIFNDFNIQSEFFGQKCTLIEKASPKNLKA